MSNNKEGFLPAIKGAIEVLEKVPPGKQKEKDQPAIQKRQTMRRGTTVDKAELTGLSVQKIKPKRDFFKLQPNEFVEKEQND